MTPFNFSDYATRLSQTLENFDWARLEPLAIAIRKRWENGDRVFLCGNGGSAANATHLVNDFIYGVAPNGKGIRAVSLTDNASIITCLANDTDYQNVFAQQLNAHANAQDLLIVFSGSGNSPNIVSALNKAKDIGMESAAVLGFGGGKSKELADIVLHFEIDDMQISEDVQQTIGHMLTLWLRENPPR